MPKSQNLEKHDIDHREQNTFKMSRIALFFLCCLPLALFSQQKMEFGVLGGFANYQGDLAEDEIVVSETKLSFGGFLRYHVNKKVKIRGNFMYGYISGNDANAEGSLKDRGWSFESNILETSFVGEYHPLGRSRVGNTGIFARQISPYLGLGLGIATHTPKVSVTDPLDIGLFPEQDEKTLSASIPLMVGIRADLFEFFSLGAELGWRATFSDYLDGVSKNGNNNKNDWYVLGGITASFFFGDLQSDFNLAPN
ncbi:MAG: outer membrane beta-barrel protein [Saprospiraceae bacterium]|nr:outer membrane beta-barrel protein [Saprospiraceae bacterium]